MTTQEVKRKLAAILSADVKEYSRLMSQDEVGTIRTLDAYKKAMSEMVVQYKGRVVDSTGDNLMAEFASVVDAVNYAVEVQRELAERNAELPDSRRMEFRIGINLGDVVEEEGRIYGDGVNIAARLQSLAEGGGICISGTVYDQVKSKLGLEYEYLGEQTVKNIAEPVRVYRVLSFPGAAAYRVVQAKSAVVRKYRKAALAIAVVLLIGVGGVLAWHFFLRPTTAVEVASKEKMAFPLPDKPSIAVLPFVNMSKDPDQEYFCDGITDQIITSLSIIPRLFVIARNSTFVYKGKAMKVNKVAEELGVRYVLEGSVQRTKDRVRILVQLIDAIKGIHLWSERYDRDLKDLFVLQDEIARQIMTALQVKLTEGEFASGIAESTSNLKALECFWRAEERFFHFAKEDNAAARQWTQKAVQLDAKFAGAWALMGWTHLWDVNYGWSKSPPQSMKEALECAQRAIGLSDSCAKAHALIGFINLLNRKFDESIENGEKAVRINPNDPIMLSILSGIMHFNGKFDESIALIKHAMRLCPYYPAFFLRPLGMSYFLADRYEEALGASELMLARAHKREFSPLLAHKSLAEAYIGLGQIDKARVHVEEMLKINPNFSLADERKRLYFYRDPSHVEHHIEALRRAGLK
jgi:TolB-like protein/class 3 adenylate cyclase